MAIYTVIDRMTMTFLPFADEATNKRSYQNVGDIYLLSTSALPQKVMSF